MPTQKFRRLAWAMVIGTYILMVLGGTTKAYGAGLSCPDWPLCFGKLIPQLNFLIFLEWFHRLIALSVGVLAILTTVAAWRIPQGRGPWVKGCFIALGILPVQAVFGGLTVFSLLDPAVDAAHLAFGTAFFSVWVILAVSASMHERGRSLQSLRLVVVPAIAAVSAYLTMIVGSFMKASGAGMGCPDWPLCFGRIIPGNSNYLTYLQFGHRLVALIAAIAVLYAAIYVIRRARQELTLVIPAGAAAGLLFIQVLIGGVAVLQTLPPAVTASHLAVAGALIGTLVALTTASHRLSAAGVVTGEVDAGSPGGGRTGNVTAFEYVKLMKPRILLLILITGYVAMWVAARGVPPWDVTLLTLLGLTLTSGGANAVNMWWDRDIDAVMKRTQGRPLPAGRLVPIQALVFGLTAGMAGVMLLAVAVNLLAAALALAGYLYYVLVYTIWLKRSSSQNIVIGGVCGALPPLVGWAAVTGSVSTPAVLMFLVIFLWTPPHFWALALFRNDDYRRAGVPMLPVVRVAGHTKWQILTYALLVIPASLLLYWTGVVGPAYLWWAVILGVWFASGCVALLREGLASASNGWARRVFGWSIVYLAGIFLAMVLNVQP